MKKMKKTRKILFAVLSVLTLASLSLGVASCELIQPSPPVTDNSSSQTTDNEFRQVYAMYVTYAEAKGETPLSYEAWLMSIRGEDGKDGVGIEKVEFDKDGNLVITFTDGTTQTVEMPKEEHVHTFGEWTAFTDEDTPCENRLFFRTCSDCKSIEWKQGCYADHTWNVVTTAPTCQAKGYDTKTCSICGKVEVDNYTDVVDHDWEMTYSYDQSFHWHKCGTCGAIKDGASHTPDSSGKCTVCNQTISTSTQAIELDLRELRLNVEKYDGMRVAFEGYVTQYSNNGVYVEQYDEESDAHYGIYVYYEFESFENAAGKHSFYLSPQNG